ncbi:SDR family oxidoreductase [Rhodococcoides kroppenstedtii]|nr:NAD(P)H-binding protein [Rhodococcus kroppenstedtii]
MTFIVHGATGAQGSPVLSALRAAGHDAVAAVRSTTAADGPAVAVDYSSVDSLVAAYEGADGVFVHLPLGTPEQQMQFARTIAEAVSIARPARVVFSTSGYALTDLETPSSAPEVLAAALRAGTVSHAVIEPRVFLENLLLPVSIGPVLSEGVLRYPIRDDYAISWSSHLDIADVAARLLTDTAVDRIVSVGALPALLGADLAEEFTAYLGRDVRFDAVSPDDYGTLIEPLFGADAVTPVVESYHWRATQPGESIPEDRSAQKLLGIDTRSVRQWLAEMNVERPQS